MRSKFVFTLLFSGLFGITGIICADPITYTYTPISVPGGSSAVARGINNAGEIVGAYNDNAGQGHGFIYQNGAYTTVDAPGGTATALLGVNNLGQIVGTYVDTSNTQRLFLDNNGTFTTIDLPGGLPTSGGRVLGGKVLAGINDLGQIVSTTFVQNVGRLGFLYNSGQFSYIPPYTGSSATSFYPSGINNGGEIALTVNQNDSESAVYLNGQLTRLPIPSIQDDQALGINNAGDVVGVYQTSQTVGGYIFSHGALTTFDARSSPNFFEIYGINDVGQLIGRGVGGAVLATPNTAATPEPSSFLLLGCGLSGLAFVARGRRKKVQE